MLVRVTRLVRPRSLSVLHPSIFCSSFSSTTPSGSPPSIPTLVQPPARIQNTAHVSSLQEYEALYKRSIADPAGFWGDIAQGFTWKKKFTKVMNCSMDTATFKWFEDGELNITENALDRHIAAGKGDMPAVTWEGDDGTSTTYTFKQVLSEVNACALALRSKGVIRGSVVTLYLPMIPALLFSMLACARLGAIHSVVFAGFSDAALAERIVAGKSAVVVTADGGMRGGRPVPLKPAMDRAVALAGERGVKVHAVFVTHRAGPGVGVGTPGWNPKLDVDLDAMVRESKASAVVTGLGGVKKEGVVRCDAVPVGAEDPLFLLYTSGSTGRPKGIVHTVGGYMVYAATTFKYLFDAAPRRAPLTPQSPPDPTLALPDTHFCAADLGWVTGHTYIGYGPLLNGTHTVIFEGTPLHPTPSRLWSLVAKHKATTLYTAPTAIRALMVHGEAPLAGHDLSSLRVIGSVGEPIGPEAWAWFYNHVGGAGRCALIDTYWQTETGGAVLTSFPGGTPMMPGWATRPFFGISPEIMSVEGGGGGAAMGGSRLAAPGESGFLTLTTPWPGMARGTWGEPERFKKSYFDDFPGRYFTGDSAVGDGQGNFRVIGRTDDVINVSGHRLGTAEVESALGLHPSVAESAVVGFPHAIKGEGIYAYVTLKGGVVGAGGGGSGSGNSGTPAEVAALKKALVDTVRKAIGPIATPDVIHITPDLPKTRSGKIMRRMLKKISAGEKDVGAMGDATTLADPSVLQRLVDSRDKQVGGK